MSGNSWASLWENCELKEYAKSLCYPWRVWSFRRALGTAAVNHNLILRACDTQDEAEWSYLACGSFLFARRISLEETLETEHTYFFLKSLVAFTICTSRSRKVVVRNVSVSFGLLGRGGGWSLRYDSGSCTSDAFTILLVACGELGRHYFLPAHRSSRQH